MRRHTRMSTFATWFLLHSVQYASAADVHLYHQARTDVSDDFHARTRNHTHACTHAHAHKHAHARTHAYARTKPPLADHWHWAALFHTLL
jgi:hypothetical protein